MGIRINAIDAFSDFAGNIRHRFGVIPDMLIFGGFAVMIMVVVMIVLVAG